jgi:phosphotransferase system enzyme I (PtsP)
MLRETFPTVPQQAALYSRVLDQAGDRPVTFRTLDIGGDKVLPYMDDASADENPAMGWRAIRIALDRPAMLRQQLRALIRAASGRSLRVMFPMVADVAEFETAREILQLELDRQRKSGEILPEQIAIGLMLEVPALIWQLPALAGRADFISVGTNDLAQFLFACDRGNPRLAERYDLLSAPMIALLRAVVATCQAAGKPLSMCGEMAAGPLDAMVLVALGFRALSLTATAIGPVKAMIRSLDVAALGRYLDEIDEYPDHSLRRRLAAYARDHAIIV